MRRHLIHFLLVAVLTVCSAATAIAQVTVKGQVVDAETGEPLIGAAVTIVGTTQGSVTNLDGMFTQKSCLRFNAAYQVPWLQGIQQEDHPERWY